MSLHKEISFEDEICADLAAAGWLYEVGAAARYDRARAIFAEDLQSWLEASQPQVWEALSKVHGQAALDVLSDRIRKSLQDRGTLDVLRYGVELIGVKGLVSLAQFAPASGMNPDIVARYQANRLRVMRQVRYSKANENCIDLVLFLNGLPVATAELKTNFTQTVGDAIDQYKFDRAPKGEPLLSFATGALVHFAVSNRDVMMTTKLEGGATRFLPFNRGNNGGAGNPTDGTGHPTAYLWQEIWQRDSWLEILGRYMIAKRDKKKQISGIIFPRYHQLDGTRRLRAQIRAEGAGGRFLIQHSAGSGKTNSIAWTAHFLADLHDGADAKIFSSVIVVSDRNVIDAQLQEALFEFERTKGVVATVTSDSGSKSAALADALDSGKKIIVCTMQTFPFALEAVRERAATDGKKFAVIADEAHSSQAGETAAKLKAVLTPEEIEEITDGGEISSEDLLAAQMAARAAKDGVTYVAFTATPKTKTMELFGRRPNTDMAASETNKPAPFHVYSMRQAIEEGFILDVLKNYTPYKLAFKLAHDGQDYDDEQVDQNRALKSLMNWVRLHPHNIAQKVQVIVEHFRANVMWCLNGRAKAMVVTSSRKEAVRYKLAMDKYIKAQGYRDVSALVAFSGEVNDPESGPSPFNESNMNPGLKGRDLREAFATDEYQVMLVANKYQTGFDQPMLVAMYVDKKLAGVSAVQTLSRLNRTYPGKTDTFVLDFVNDPDEILAAFRTYFRTAQLAGVSDPNLIHDLQAKLDATGIYLPEEVDGFAEAYYRKGTQKDLQARIGPAVERFRVRYTEAEQQKDKKAIEALDLFRKDLGGFVRAYDFLSQIVDYGDSDLFKRSLFYKHLSPLITEEVRHEAIDLSSVLMTHYNLRDLGKRKLGMGEPTEEPTTLDPMTGIGSRVPQDPKAALLSEIVHQMNDLFEGEELTDSDRINYVNHIADKMMESEVLARQAAANQKVQFGDSPDFMNAFEDAVMAAYENHKSMSEQVMGKSHVKKAMAAMLLDLVYRGFNEKRIEEGGTE